MAFQRQQNVIALQPRFGEIELLLSFGGHSDERLHLHAARAEHLIQGNILAWMPLQPDVLPARGFVEDIPCKPRNLTVRTKGIDGRGIVNTHTHHSRRYGTPGGDVPNSQGEGRQRDASPDYGSQPQQTNGAGFKGPNGYCHRSFYKVGTKKRGLKQGSAQFAPGDGLQVYFVWAVGKPKGPRIGPRCGEFEVRRDTGCSVGLNRPVQNT